MDYITFRKMITPIIMMFFFWLFIFINTVWAFFQLFDGSFVTSLLSLTLGNVMIRVLCEMFILMFKMHATQEEILKVNKKIAGIEDTYEDTRVIV